MAHGFDEQGERLAGMPHDEGRFGIARSGLMERFDGRPVPPLLGRFETIGQEDQPALAANEVPGEESRDGQVSPSADQLGHVPSWGMEEGEQPVVTRSGEPVSAHETGNAGVIGADTHGDQNHEEPKESALAGAGGAEGGNDGEPMNPE